MTSMQQWTEAFDARLKTKAYEQFGLLLCDPEKAPAEQVALLHSLLFTDHRNVSQWRLYVDLAVKSSNTRKLQLQRLVNKALECLEECDLLDADFLLLHLQSASLKSTSREALKYFENVIWKRGIGTTSASLYLGWAEAAVEATPEDLAPAVDALQKGMQAGAEPAGLLRERLRLLGQVVTGPASTPAAPTIPATALTVPAATAPSAAGLPRKGLGGCQRVAVGVVHAQEETAPVASGSASTSASAAAPADVSVPRKKADAKREDKKTADKKSGEVKKGEVKGGEAKGEVKREELKSRYLDAALLNFDPKRRKGAASSSASTSATASAAPASRTSTSSNPRSSTSSNTSNARSSTSSKADSSEDLSGPLAEQRDREAEGEKGAVGGSPRPASPASASFPDTPSRNTRHSQVVRDSAVKAREAEKGGVGAGFQAFCVDAVASPLVGEANPLHRGKHAPPAHASAPAAAAPAQVPTAVPTVAPTSPLPPSAMDTTGDSGNGDTDAPTRAFRTGAPTGPAEEPEKKQQESWIARANREKGPTGTGSAKKSGSDGKGSSSGSSARAAELQQLQSLGIASATLDAKENKENKEGKEGRKDRENKEGKESKEGREGRDSKRVSFVASKPSVTSAKVQAPGPVAGSGSVRNSSSGNSSGNSALPRTPGSTHTHSTSANVHSARKQPIAPPSAPTPAPDAEASSSSSRGSNNSNGSSHSNPSTHNSGNHSTHSNGNSNSGNTNSGNSSGSNNNSGSKNNNSGSKNSPNILQEPARRVQLNGRHYTRLNVLGKGGSSCVWRIIGNECGRVYAYKRVDVRDGDDVDAVFDSYANEINLLRRLNGSDGSGGSGAGSGGGSGGGSGIISGGGGSGPNGNSGSGSGGGASSRIIELVDFEVCREQRYIAMLLEAGDVDLAKVLAQKNAALRQPGTENAMQGQGQIQGQGQSQILPQAQSQVQSQAQMDPFFARMAWREMLEAVQHIHTHRIVHGDLKPANFVFVRGHLKLIDFGIAKSFTSDTTNIYRESQIGTINYMAPEAIAPMSQEECDEHGDQERLKMRLGRASDIWSLGCILYQIVFGRPPFAALNTIQKLATIPSPKHVIRYPDWGEAAAVDAMRACLVHDPRARRGIAGPEGLLLMPYLQLMSSPSPSVSAATATAATAAEAATAEAQEQVRELQVQLARAQAQREGGWTESGGAEQGLAGPEQLQGVVGAVLDSLSNLAQQAVVRAQATGRAGASTRVTRNSKSGSAEAAAAERFCVGVVGWLDEVDQGEVEARVAEVVGEWSLPQTHTQTAQVHAQTQTQTDVGAGEGAGRGKRKLGDAERPGCAKKTQAHSSSINSSGGDSGGGFLASIRLQGASQLRSAESRPALIPAPAPASSASTSASASTIARPPMPALPPNILQQIQSLALMRRDRNDENIPPGAEAGAGVKGAQGLLQDAGTSERAARWMRPVEEGVDMRAVLERRIGEMRRFLDVDQDNVTSTETLDMTGFNDFF